VQLVQGLSMVSPEEQTIKPMWRTLRTSAAGAYCRDLDKSDVKCSSVSSIFSMPRPGIESAGALSMHG
jgi:hypothetical protein